MKCINNTQGMAGGNIERRMVGQTKLTRNIPWLDIHEELNINTQC